MWKNASFSCWKRNVCLLSYADTHTKGIQNNKIIIAFIRWWLIRLVGIYSINFYQTLNSMVDMILFKYFTLTRDHRHQIANLLRPIWYTHTHTQYKMYIRVCAFMHFWFLRFASACSMLLCVVDVHCCWLYAVVDFSFLISIRP